LLLTIADVCGKGMQAALSTASVHTMVHACARAGMPLTEMMNHLNDYLIKTLPDQSFITMITMELHRQSGEMQCVNAGHPAALILDTDNQARWTVEGEYLPLGIVEQTFAAAEDRVATGEMLGLFTDGLTELYGSDGKMLGPAGVANLFAGARAERSATPAATIIENAVTATDRLLAGQPALDDRTLMVVCRNG
ncbi:MAG: serine/threonine-protein phosphatase, partial [Rhodospirillales bacterium]|nr:serine/threonine-protein phosphatase [Rhodospirillales bacterium]